MAKLTLELHYLKKKIELNTEARNAVSESNIRDGLVKDYILALLLKEQDNLDKEAGDL